VDRGPRLVAPSELPSCSPAMVRLVETLEGLARVAP
jgi:hypothetical protein